MSSIFTQIRRGEVNAQPVIYEDERAFIIVSDKPHTEGHVLVIPVEEVDHYEDADESTLAHISILCKRVAKVLKRVYGADRIGIAVDGFGVPHLHVHVMPIYNDDGGIWHVDQLEVAPLDELKRVSKKIKAELENSFD